MNNWRIESVRPSLSADLVLSFFAARHPSAGAAAAAQAAAAQAAEVAAAEAMTATEAAGAAASVGDVLMSGVADGARMDAVGGGLPLGAGPGIGILGGAVGAVAAVAAGEGLSYL